MHYLYLTALNVPEVEPEPIIDTLIKEYIEHLKGVKTDKKDYFLECYISRLNARRTAFEREVEDLLDEKLEPYCEQTENEKYLEFDDRTAELKNEYENETTDCFRLPEGKLVSGNNMRIWKEFFIGADGKVYQTSYGRLKQPKRSKKAKKMRGLKNYPWKKLYKSLDDFAKNEYGFYYNETFKGYGYVCNPNAFYDWYQMGGRWPDIFIVKEDCTDVSKGEKSWAERPASEIPPGYKWVCCARKKDIEWELMKKHDKEILTKEYYIMEKAFSDGKLPEGYYGNITQEGITTFGEYLYKKGETLPQFLSRKGIIRKYKYPNIACGYLNNEGEHTNREYMEYSNINNSKRLWRRLLDNFIDALPDDAVLVGVDCHI